MKIAILASDEARYVDAIARGLRDGSISSDVTISVVITNKPHSRVIGVCAEHGIQCKIIDHSYFNDRIEHDKTVREELDKHNPDLVILGTYMRIIQDPDFIREYGKGMINIHHSLLPQYSGKSPHITAFKEAAIESGYTIHFVNEFVDDGEIVIQEPVNIEYCKSAEEVYNAILETGCEGIKKVLNDFAQKTASLKTSTL